MDEEVVVLDPADPECGDDPNLPLGQELQRYDPAGSTQRQADALTQGGDGVRRAAATVSPVAVQPQMLLMEATTGHGVARLRIVRMVFATLVLLVIEGALRKWMAPSAQKALFFIRDPFALACLYLAVRYRFLRWSPLTLTISFLALGFVFLASYQVIALNLDPLVAGYGWRNYFLYAGFALVMAAVLRRSDIIAMIRWSLWMTLPMAVLAYVQWNSPADAWVNQGIGGGESFTVSQGVVRTNGTFTFTTGFVCFVGASFAALSAAAFTHDIRRWLVLAGGVAVVTCLATSGARTAYVHAALSGLAVIACEMFRPLARQRPAIYLGAFALTIGLVAALWLFHPRALDLMAERSAAAAKVEDPAARAFGLLTGGFAAMEDAGYLGHGLGMSTGGGSSVATGKRAFTLAEEEFPRVVLEGGLLLGMAYMLLRFALAGWLVLAAIRCIRRNDDPLPLLLVPFPVMLLVVGQLTMQGSVNGYGWISTGLVLAAIATSSVREETHV